ncbi:unnamed protein product [Ilex paraguariensis]|uniref:Uncharacterized protein n=1 Tax=Ilex paraguariensis TaxID=185542 RepID=A0ABC8TM16_9AQUA
MLKDVQLVPSRNILSIASSSNFIICLIVKPSDHLNNLLVIHVYPSMLFLARADSDMTGQMLSRSQQWDHNIAAKVAEFTATFEKEVLALNIISRKRDLGEFRSEERLIIEQALLQEERRALIEVWAEIGSRQKACREAHGANLRNAAIVHPGQAHGEIIVNMRS